MIKAYLGSLIEKDYLENFREGLEFIKFGEKVRHDTKVFLKPNLTFPEFRPGVMTNPLAVTAAIQAIRDYTPHIWIGDSDSGGYNRFSMDEVYRSTGLLDICRKYDVKIVNLSKVQRRSIKINCKGKGFKLDLPSLILDETDFVITLPVPKIHCNTGVSLTFKNQWGCIPENQDRLRLHPYFRPVILEVNKAIRTKVAIIDGKYGLNVNGPLRGQPVELDWVLVADHIGVGARVGCELMQVPTREISHLRYAESQGMLPHANQIVLNRNLEPFLTTRFYLRRKMTDLPGLLAFNYPFVAYLAYFSPLAKILHKLLYVFREPFYDYDSDK